MWFIRIEAEPWKISLLNLHVPTQFENEKKNEFYVKVGEEIKNTIERYSNTESNTVRDLNA